MSPASLPHIGRVDSNLAFLIIEVTSQVESARGFLHAPSAATMRRIAGRDDYVDSLKRLVEEQCFRSLHAAQELSEPDRNLLRATITVANNLERLGDLCVNFLRQAAHVEDQTLLQEPVLHDGLNEVLASLPLVSHALHARNVPLAMRICKAEDALDRLYHETLERVLSSLDSVANRGDWITFVNMVHYLERMGDLLLNIGEAVVFAAVGARMKLGDYRAVADMLNRIEARPSPPDVQMERIWDSRSGMRVGRVFGHTGDTAPDLIVKEGNLDKLMRERDSISRWQALCPGLTPKVFGYREDGPMAALLMEYLHGRTLQAMMMAGEERDLTRACERLCETLRGLWSASRTEVPREPDFVSQTMARLHDVRRLHPSLFSRGRRIGSLSVASLESLLGAMRSVEESIEVPFSVLIHGDFNTNNVIYDEAEDRLHLIDLYRSTEGDYIQDASVFLVSCFRIPVFSAEVRARLNRVETAFLAFTREFAADHGDLDVDRRLALGLVRSLITSTRFIPDALFAEQLFVRAVYLMEALQKATPTAPFHVPDAVLIWKGELAA